MERRILAELFVDDDRAIEMDKGTIDYAKDVIDYQCQECGVSTGDMRILDDDDPEDAKASDLADKIFNSEENKHMKVWALSYETTVPFQDPVFHERLFDSYEKALKEFNQTVEDDKKWFLENTKNPKIREGNDYFKIEDFTYTEYWYSIIKIVEKEVL